MTVVLKLSGNGRTVEIRPVKSLFIFLEQDLRFIKRITAPMMGSEALNSATTIAGFKIAHMIRKGQILATGSSACQIIIELAADVCPLEECFPSRRQVGDRTYL